MKFLSFFLLSVLILMTGQGVVSCTDDTSNKSQKKSKDELVDLDNDSLLALASNYLDRDQTVNKAVVCYTIVAGRNSRDKLSREESLQKVRALVNLGFLYSNYLFDFPKAYDYLMEAKEIAEAEKLNKILPYIYLNLGVVYDSYAHLYPYSEKSGFHNKEALSLLKKAYEMAFKEEERRPFIYSFNNLVHFYFNGSLSSEEMAEYVRMFQEMPVSDADPIEEDSQMLCRGMRSYIEGDTTKALLTIDSLIKTDRDKGLVTDQTDYQLYMVKASMLERIGLQEEADSLLSKMASEIRKNGNVHTILWMAEVMAERYDINNDSVGALQARMEYHDAREKIESQNSINSIGGLEFYREMRTLRENEKREHQTRVRLATTLTFVIIVGVLVILLLLFIVIYLRNKRLYLKKLYERNLELLKKNEASEDRKEDDTLIKNIEKVFDTPDIICESDFSLTKLAHLVSSNTSYVSQAINKTYGVNFNSILNQRRIMEACRRMLDKKYSNYTIEAIAESVGIKSRSNFSAVFKKETGLTPTEFKKMSPETNEDDSAQSPP